MLRHLGTHLEEIARNVREVRGLTDRYRILHTAGRLTRTARAVTLRLDRTWTWAQALARALTRLHTAFA